MTARIQPSQGGDTRAIEAWLRTRRAEEALRRPMVSRSGWLDTGVTLPVMGSSANSVIGDARKTSLRTESRDRMALGFDNPPILD